MPKNIGIARLLAKFATGPYIRAPAIDVPKKSTNCILSYWLRITPQAPIERTLELIAKKIPIAP